LAKERRLAEQFVQGFHAADPRRIGVHALAGGGSPGDDRRERRLERVTDGYDRVLAPAVATLGTRIQLSTIVTAIEWGRRRVRVRSVTPAGRARPPLSARAVIVSIPLGVLQATPPEKGAIRFEPPLASKSSALERLAMGTVVRVVFRLRRRFWAEDAFIQRRSVPDLDQLDFLHTADATFPTWWSAYPDTSPLLVAWCGGPAARTLSGLGTRAVTQRALRTLGDALGVSATAPAARGRAHVDARLDKRSVRARRL
jgi:monoamine oxidase